MLRNRVIKLVVPASLAAGVALSSLALFAPDASAATATTYTVTSGQTLSAIAPGLGTTWPALASYNHLADPDDIEAGQVLQVPPAGYTAPAVSSPVQSEASSASSAVPTPSVSSGSSGSASGSVADCIRDRENGGSYGRSSNPTHFGAYQFDYSTWVANGGSPADWGTASPGEQDQVFANTVASSGYSAWTSYDGC